MRLAKHRYKIEGGTATKFALLLDCGHVAVVEEEGLRAPCEACAGKRWRVPEGTPGIKLWRIVGDGSAIVACRSCARWWRAAALIEMNGARWWRAAALIEMNEVFPGSELVCACGQRSMLRDTVNEEM